MSLFLLFAVMLACMAVGMNIGLAMIASSLVYLLVHTGPTALPLAILPMKMLYGVDSFPLLAVPLFMLAGELMSAGGITSRIVRFATALVGWITGGLAHVNIVVNMIMAGMSGSAVADAAATGSVSSRRWCGWASRQRSPPRSRRRQRPSDRSFHPAFPLC